MAGHTRAEHGVVGTDIGVVGRDEKAPGDEIMHVIAGGGERQQQAHPHQHALAPEGGVDFIGRDAEYGRKVRDEWTTTRYHKPGDVVRPDWDLSGAAQDVDLLLEVGYQVANGDKFPEWKPGNEFRVKRSAPRGQ